VGLGDSGYGWHFGLKAFQFVRPTDPGYSLWIPLQEVGPETGGGVLYVPADIWSGRERIKLVSHQLGKIDAATDEEAAKLVAEMAAEYPALSFIRGYEREMLRPIGIEPTFAIGDALLFSRWVWHCSSSFRPQSFTGEGPAPRRVAYTMRFVGSESRMCKPFTRGLRRYYKLREEAGAATTGGSGEKPAFATLEDGELLSSSPGVFPVS
jgi:hypothetical protein